jgi:hypothetical protein
MQSASTFGQNTVVAKWIGSQAFNYPQQYANTSKYHDLSPCQSWTPTYTEGIVFACYSLLQAKEGK